jgi:hypothetical protein
MQVTDAAEHKAVLVHIKALAQEQIKLQERLGFATIGKETDVDRCSCLWILTVEEDA